ncbi:HNH endonuclease [Vaginisenegalia massiliensis]|uniref:HNH endonuclease n=1 Tax=Vaginisenegalia massiliensis TaxID=2058294 RepID=UPI000F54C4DC|nr:HNH endonuclease signature motif containing protein [Vaginisenegalia massiliensis]
MIDKPYYNKLLKWIKEDKLVKFYQSKQWRQVRQERMKIDNNECQLCKHEGRYHKAEMVHHIVHVKDNPLLALSMSNLLSLCNHCHNLEHPEKLLKQKPKFTNEERW